MSQPFADIELSDDPMRIAPRYLRARLLVRLHGSRWGLVDCPFVGGRITASQLRARITDQLGDAIARHAAQDGLDAGPSGEALVGSLSSSPGTADAAPRA